MGKQKSESGSAHLVIIIVLIVALLGTLGFVYWQNFIQPKSTIIDNATQTKSTTTDNAIQKTTVDANQKTLTVPEWGVEGIYSSPNTLSYTVEGAGRYNDAGVPSATTLFFTVKNREQCGSIEPIIRTVGGTPLTDFGIYVDDNSSEVTVADEFPSDGISSNINGTSIEHKHIGNYYYLYRAPTLGNWPSADFPEECKDTTKHAENVKSIHDFFQSLKSL